MRRAKPGFLCIILAVIGPDNPLHNDSRNSQWMRENYRREWDYGGPYLARIESSAFQGRT